METLNDLTFTKPKHDHLKPKTVDNIKEDYKRKIKDMKDKSKMIKNINDTIKQIMDCSNVSMQDSSGNITLINKLEISDISIIDSDKKIKKSELTIDFTYLSYYLNCTKYIFTTLYDLVDIYHFVEYNTIINNLRYLNGITITIKDTNSNSCSSNDFSGDSRTFLSKCEELETIFKNINDSLLNFDRVNIFKFTALDKRSFEFELKLQLNGFINSINDSVIVLNSIKESYDKLED